jgi:hypothetical protein
MISVMERVSSLQSLASLWGVIDNYRCANMELASAFLHAVLSNRRELWSTLACHRMHVNVIGISELRWEILFGLSL